MYFHDIKKLNYIYIQILLQDNFFFEYLVEGNTIVLLIQIILNILSGF